ncbi:MAG: hypothetical protein NTX00_01125 [Candidatus Parcubacteria bacterium]|nr:hypothetical protein [Candidatus Parcubacteria bacterium]
MPKFETITSPELKKIKAIEDRYAELKKKHPDNPLFKTEFSKDVPKDYVSVYRTVPEKYIDEVGRHGLKPNQEILTDIEMVNQKLGWLLKYKECNKIFNKFAPKGFSRGNVVYAFPDQYGWFGWRKDEKNSITIEIKLDPKNVLVVNAAFWNQAFPYPNSEKSIVANAKEYWGSAVPLTEFRKEEWDEWEGRLPEVLIPFKVNTKFLKVVKE